MYVIVAKLDERPYLYGPYATRELAQDVIEKAKERKGDRAPDMTIVALQSSDAFLVGCGAATYQPPSADCIHECGRRAAAGQDDCVECATALVAMGA